MQASAKYEVFVAGLAQALLRNGDASQVRFGVRNHVAGAYGVKHQVDVSFLDRATVPHTLVLIECKYIRQPIKLAYVKVLKATVDDISIQQMNVRVQGILVSLRGAQRGASKYAAHYGIDLQVVADGSFYRFKYADLELIAATGTARGRSTVLGCGAAILACASCGARFERNGSSALCGACARSQSDG